MMREVRCIPDSRGNGQQRAQHSAMNGGDEQVDDGRSVPGTPLSAVHDAPPEDRGAPEETQMLDRVHGLVLERGVVQRRNVPDPQSETVEDEGQPTAP